VLAIRSNHHLRFIAQQGIVETDPKTIADDLSAEAWTKLAAGEGAKGLRLYAWARISLPWAADEGFERWLMIRRSLKEPEKLAYYLVYAPAGTLFTELAGAAGLRWTIEECFERAKDDLGLDHCEARSWHGWHRHMSLVMAAGAFLAKLAADLKRSVWSKPNETSPKAPIAA
jgi:SRSO17 transposase